VSTATRTRRLWLIRHADAADPRPGGSDFERRLTRRGERQCRLLGAWLLERAQDSTASALVSPAQRTQETADRVLAGWFVGARVAEPRIWNAGPAALGELIENNAGDLVLVGHNPGLERVQAALTGRLLPLPTAGGFELESDPARGWVLCGAFQPPSDST